MPEPTDPSFRRCTTCGEWRSAQFGFASNGKGGFTRQCKRCKSIANVRTNRHRRVTRRTQLATQRAAQHELWVEVNGVVSPITKGP